MPVKRLAHSFLFACACLPAHTYAASFDCRKASTPSEMAICQTPQLSELDETLSALYRGIARFTATGDSTNVTDQRRWLKITRQTCDKSHEISSCLLSRYGDRVAELKETPRDARSRISTGHRYTVDEVSPSFDFSLELRDSCTEDLCEAPGQIVVIRKGRTDATDQLIDLPNIVLTFDSGGVPLANSSDRYGYQGTINTGDFNFDGLEDFAVLTGNRGSYGGPSYDVFLFDRNKERFLHSPALSSLTITGLGFFDVDSKARELIEHTKSGCCYQETTYYSVRNNMPVPKRRDVEDATGDDVRSFTEMYVNGKWQ